MRALTLICKNKFGPVSISTGKKKLEKWKILVSGLAFVATGLLLTALVLSSRSETENFEEDEPMTQNSEVVVKSSSEKLLEVAERMLPMARIYCSIINCVVTCSLIPAASNPGLVAAVILTSDYKKHCPESWIIEELIFANCRFPNDHLSSEWFPVNLQFKKLTFTRCSLTFINPSAFASWKFEELTSLRIIENSISLFQKSLFDNLTKLEELVIVNNGIQQAEADLLAGTANSLQILQIDNSINSENVLTNITGKSSLPNVLLLSLTGNSLETISANIFQGVPNVQSVYLTNSAVLKIEAKAFDAIAGSIRQLFLSDNKISSLPNNILESILTRNKNFKLTIGNNLWNCSCDLQWLKKLVTDYSIVTDEPRCVQPEQSSKLTFYEAQFCHGDNRNETPISYPVTVTTDKISRDDDTSTSVTEGNLVTLLCEEEMGTPSTSSNRKLLSVREMSFKSRLPSFAVEESENGSVYVSLGTTTDSYYTVIWFCNKYKDGAADFSPGNINCVTNVKSSFYLNNLQPGSLYTICVLDVYLDVTSPFDCISLKKSRNYYEQEVDKEATWLANKHKAIIITGLTCVFILACVVSVIGSCYVVRKNPKLLRGSKRVIMVRHRTADAIILPDGIQQDMKKEKGNFESLKIEDNPSHKDYVTPMSKRRLLLARRISISSGTSSHSSTSSYVTGIEPTSMQLMSWRIARIREILSCHNPSPEIEDHPPPLPPPRNKSILSLSLNVQKRERGDADGEDSISDYARGRDAGVDDFHQL